MTRPLDLVGIGAPHDRMPGAFQPACDHPDQDASIVEHPDSCHLSPLSIPSTGHPAVQHRNRDLQKRAGLTLVAASLGPQNTRRRCIRVWPGALASVLKLCIVL